MPDGPTLELFPDCCHSSTLQIREAQGVSLPGLQILQLLLPVPPDLCSEMIAIFVLASGERDRTGKIFPFPAGPGSNAGAQPLDRAQPVLVLSAWPMQASLLGV